MTSRVHELARKSLTELIGLRKQLLVGAGHGQRADEVPDLGWNRDHLVTWIRDLEDPRLWLSTGTTFSA